MTAGRQLGLFDPPAARDAHAADRELMRQVPEWLCFGTSSWTFPGWAGLVYEGRPSERELAERGLEEYARHPLFRSVGIDRSYYAPLDTATLARYRAQLPAGFRWVMKAFAGITSAVHPRTRDPNPHFLDAERCAKEVLDPLLEHFSEHSGKVVFELMPLRAGELPEPSAFAERLAVFLGRLPRELSYAVELRNRELLTHRYVQALQSAGAGHVFSYWERMPTLAEQLDVPGALLGDVVVARLLIPPGQRYEERKRQLAPFDRIVDPREDMRADVMRLARACELLGKVLLVIVNNKAEGSSPLTVRALAERWVREASDPPPDGLDDYPH